MQETKYFLEWKTTLPSWGIALLAILLVIWVYWCYRRESVTTSSKGGKFILGLLRTIILITLLVIFCEPVLHESEQKTRKPTVLFLVDRSMSMKNSDSYLPAQAKAIQESCKLGDKQASQTSRIEIARLTMENSSQLAAWKNDCEVKLYQFAEDYSELKEQDEWKPDGQRTDIYSNLIKVVDSMHGKAVSGVFILSDGQHNTCSTPEEKEHTLQQAVSHLVQRGTAVYTVGVGSAEKKRDIIITGVEAPEFALLKDKVRFDVEIKHVGYTNETVPLELWWGESLLAQQNVTLDKENQAQKVEISHSFTQPGKYTLTLRIPPQAREFQVQNNSRRHNLEVIERRFRVLYLEGLPRWEYRYLKNAMIRDTTTVTNTWLYDADSEFPQEKSKDGPEMTQSPEKKDLQNFDCIILGDVPLDKLEAEFQRGIREFVEEGGGLVLIAGMQSNPHEYIHSGLEPVLPIQLDERPEWNVNYDQEARPLLTPEGKLHPMLQLASDADENRSLWESQLPGFYWYYPITKAKPAATVLAVASNKQPLLITQMYGKGRVFFSAMDSTWRWRKPLNNDTITMNPDRYFYRFWGQAIRHVSMNKLLGNSRLCFLRVENTEYYLGDKIRVILTIRDPQVEKNPQEFEVLYAEPDTEAKPKKLTPSESDVNSLETTFLATQLGQHKIWFMDEGKEVSVSFNVIPSQAEAGDVELNEKDLQKLAQQTQGKYTPIHEMEQMLQTITPKPEVWNEDKSETPYWNNWWWVTIVLAVWTLEWVLRKIARML